MENNKPRVWWLNKHTCEFHIEKLSDDDIHVIEFSAYEQALARISILKSRASQFESTMSETIRVRDEALARIAELKAANANCISLSLHEARMNNAEEKIDEITARVIQLTRIKDKLITAIKDARDAFREIRYAMPGEIPENVFISITAKTAISAIDKALEDTK